MIWLKRLLPFVILAGAWFGFSYYREQRLHEEVSTARQVAEVTARVWLAGIELRPDSAAYLAFRDSIFSAEGLSVKEVEQFLKEVRREPIRYDTFAVLLNHYIDSMGRDLSGDRVDSLTIDSIIEADQ